MMAVMALMMKTVLMMMPRQAHRNCADVDGGGGGGGVDRFPASLGKKQVGRGN